MLDINAQKDYICEAEKYMDSVCGKYTKLLIWTGISSQVYMPVGMLSKDLCVIIDITCGELLTCWFMVSNIIASCKYNLSMFLMNFTWKIKHVSILWMYPLAFDNWCVCGIFYVFAAFGDYSIMWLWVIMLCRSSWRVWCPRK